MGSMRTGLATSARHQDGAINPRCLCLAQVVSVGPDVKLSIAAGDNVVFQKYAMAEVGLAPWISLSLPHVQIFGQQSHQN